MVQEGRPRRAHPPHGSHEQLLEAVAETLRERRKTPTSEAFLDYVKAMTVDKVLEATQALIDQCPSAQKEGHDP